MIWKVRYWRDGEWVDWASAATPELCLYLLGPKLYVNPGLKYEIIETEQREAPILIEWVSKGRVR